MILANCVGTLDFDAEVDGTLEGRWIFRYNDMGDPTEAAYDNGANGSIDSRMLFGYEADHLVDRAWDANADGTPETHTFYLYDSQNRLEEERVEAGGEMSDRVSYDYDDESRVKRQAHWKGEQGTTLYELGLFTWIGPLKKSVLWAAGGTESLVTYDYDDGRLVREEIHHGTSPTASQRELTTWDEQGRKAQVDKDVQADGQPDYRSSWSYECW